MATISSLCVYGRKGFGHRLQNVTVLLLGEGGEELHLGLFVNKVKREAFRLSVPAVEGVAVVKLIRGGEAKGGEQVLNLVSSERRRACASEEARAEERERNNLISGSPRPSARTPPLTLFIPP